MQTVFGVHGGALHGAARRERTGLLGLDRLVAGAALVMLVASMLSLRSFSSVQPLPVSAAGTVVSAAATQLRQAVAAAVVATQPTMDPAAILAARSRAATQAVQAAILQNPAQSWGVAVYDLDNNTWVTRINGDQDMQTASLYKLYAVYGVAHRVPFTQWDSVHVGGRTLKACVDLMLRVSDNPCGLAVMQYAGWGTTDRLATAAGFSETHVALADGPQTSANDMVAYMTKLYRGELFDKPTTAFVMNSLANQYWREAIPAGCTGCTVYNKTGNNGNVAHDVAIVKQGGHTYAVAMMSTGGTYGKIANVERALNISLSKTAAAD